jgi:hypothetical protein
MGNKFSADYDIQLDDDIRRMQSDNGEAIFFKQHGPFHKFLERMQELRNLNDLCTSLQRRTIYSEDEYYSEDEATDTKENNEKLSDTEVDRDQELISVEKEIGFHEKSWNIRNRKPLYEETTKIDYTNGKPIMESEYMANQKYFKLEFAEFYDIYKFLLTDELRKHFLINNSKFITSETNNETEPKESNDLVLDLLLFFEMYHNSKLDKNRYVNELFIAQERLYTSIIHFKENVFRKK